MMSEIKKYTEKKESLRSRIQFLKRNIDGETENYEKNKKERREYKGTYDSDYIMQQERWISDYKSEYDMVLIEYKSISDYIYSKGLFI